MLVQVVGKLGDLANPVTGGDRSQHWLGIPGAKQFRLPPPDHLLQQVQVLRIVLQHVVEQPAADMHGEMEIRVMVHDLQEWPVAAHVGVIQHVGKIAHRLVSVDTE